MNKPTQLAAAATLFLTLTATGCTSTPANTTTVTTETPVVESSTTTTTTETTTTTAPAEPTATTPAPATTTETTATTATAPATKQEYTRYANKKYGYSVDRPSWMRVEEAQDGAGITVTAPTGGVMTTWVEDTPDTFAGELETFRNSLKAEGVTVTSAKDMGSRGLMISGTVGKDIVYYRYQFGEVKGRPTTAVLRWRYSADKKSLYDTVVTRSADTFTPPKG